MVAIDLAYPDLLEEELPNLPEAEDKLNSVATRLALDGGMQSSSLP
jgi:hypothetical protein